MNKKLISSAVLAAAVALGSSVAQAASSVTVAFPTSSSSVTASVGFLSSSEVGYFWSVGRGDQISQSYSSTGLFGASSLSMNLHVTQNVLNSGAHVSWDVLVNGIDVGDWTWSQADGTGFTNVSLSFGAIAGEFNSLALVVKNEVASGQGSIALGLDTRTTVTAAIPEPETYAMMLAGLGLLGLVARRRKQKAA